MKFDLDSYRKELEGKSAREICAWPVETFEKPNVILASSMSLEDQVLTDMLSEVSPGSRVFILDTGRHFEATYDTLHRSMSYFNVKYEILEPDAKEVSEMIQDKGPNLFFESVENRKLCCEIRKVRPLKKVLQTVSAWICGLRREQSITRKEINSIEWDSENNIFKINPIFDWTFEAVWKYVKERGLPYNLLHDKGFPSIGCEPCTRAIEFGEDIRAGRWWWERPESRECGLHIGKKK